VERGLSLITPARDGLDVRVEPFLGAAPSPSLSSRSLESMEPFRGASPCPSSSPPLPCRSLESVALYAAEIGQSGGKTNATTESGLSNESKDLKEMSKNVAALRVPRLCAVIKQALASLDKCVEEGQKVGLQGNKTKQGAIIGRGLHSFTLELNLRSSRTHS